MTINRIAKIETLANPRADYDGFWKEVIELYFQPFIEFFYPKAAQDIDWSRGFAFLDKEFQKLNRNGITGKNIVDKLVRIYRKNGNPHWVLIHIELQCQPLAKFNQNFYLYHCRLFDYFQVPVASIAILADNNPYWKPSCYWHELWDCKAGMSFPTVKLLDYQDKGKELEKNPLGMLIFAYLKAMETKKNSEDRYSIKLQLTKSLYQKGFNKETILKLYRFIDWVLALPSQLELKYTNEIFHFEKELNVPYITSAERIGIAKGKKEGRYEEKLEVAKSLLSNGVDPKIVEKSTRLSHKKIQELKQQIF
jgi:hypothetical protein